MEEPVKEKRTWFEVYNALKTGDKMADAKEAKTAWAKGIKKHAVWLARSRAEKEEFTTVSSDDDGNFCIDCTNQDVIVKTVHAMTLMSLRQRRDKGMDWAICNAA